MILLSVELLDGILCLLEELVVAPWPNVRMEPVWPLQSWWVWWDASMYQMILEIESAGRVSTKYLVPCRYLRMRFNFPQPSSSGCLTRVVKNAIVVWMSRWTRERNRICATVWWKARACSSGRSLASVGGRTLNRWSAAGLEDTPVIFSGKAVKICWGMVSCQRQLLLCWKNQWSSRDNHDDVHVWYWAS